MRIVEYGHIKPKEVKCNHCGAILEYVPNDLMIVRDTYLLVCPVCESPIIRNDNGNKLTKN